MVCATLSSVVAGTIVRRSAVIVAGVIAFLCVAGCSVGDDTDVIDVFAAASLTDAFTELAREFEAANPGLDVRLNFAGSSTLREQLLDGAQADVFASANMAIMDQLVDAGAVTGPAAVMASNGLALAVPIGNPGEVQTLADLSRDELLVGICTEGVPCGDLARATLADAGVDGSIDTEEPDARALVRRLADGELDVALVYGSDFAGFADQLRNIKVAFDFPSTSYPIAVVDDSDVDAHAFVEFVLGPTGQQVLARWGFDTT